MVCLSGLRLQLKGGRAQYGTYGDCGMWFPPGFAFETMQPYTVPPPPMGEPITLCHSPKQRCHLTILSQIWKHVYLCEMTTGLSLWRKTLSCPVCLRAVKNGAGWQMREKANKMWEKRKNIQSCKYVTTASLKKTFSPKPQQCSLCEYIFHTAVFTTDQTNQIITGIKIELFWVFYRCAKNPSFLRLPSPVAALDNF